MNEGDLSQFFYSGVSEELLYRMQAHLYKKGKIRKEDLEVYAEGQMAVFAKWLVYFMDFSEFILVFKMLLAKAN